MKRTVILSTFILLTGCGAGAPQTIADSSNSSSIKSIAIVTPYVSDSPMLGTNSLGGSLLSGLTGGIGGAIIGAERIHKQTEFDTMAANNGFSASEELKAGLAQELAAKGYITTDTPAPRPNADFLATYPASSTSAYLDVVVINYGYYEGAVSAYKPVLAVKYRLVRASDNQVIMQGTFGNTSSYTGYTADDADDMAAFADVSTYQKNAIDGLHDEMTNTAKAVAAAMP